MGSEFEKWGHEQKLTPSHEQLTPSHNVFPRYHEQRASSEAPYVTLLIDLDDTIVATSEAQQAQVEKLYGITSAEFDLRTRTVFDVDKGLVHTCANGTQFNVEHAMRAAMQVENFVRDLEPIPFAVQKVKQLMRHPNCRVYFVTAPLRDANSASPKLDWIARYFGEEAVDLVFITTAKHLIQGHFLFDDRVQESAGATWQQIFYPQSWNAQLQNVRRMSAWRELDVDSFVWQLLALKAMTAPLPAQLEVKSPKSPRSPQSPPILLINMDDTLVAMSDALQSQLEKMCGITSAEFDVRQRLTFDLPAQLVITCANGTEFKVREALCRVMQAKNFIRDLKPIPFAVEKVQQLMHHAQCQVYFVTSALRDVDSATPKLLWIKHFFGDDARKRLVIGTPKHMIRGNFFLENEVQHLAPSSEWKQIFYPQPWNAHLQNVRRTLPWSELDVNDFVASLQKP
jgi:5'(3')-deoxyribonucleotidase